MAWWQQSGPFDLVIVFGMRTDEQQRALYAQGRTTPGKIVTNAPDGSSTAHGRGGAIDCQPVRDSAGDLVKSIWTGDEADPFDRSQAHLRLEQYVKLVKEHGLRSGADFPGLADLPHAEDEDWESLPYPPLAA